MRLIVKRLIRLAILALVVVLTLRGVERLVVYPFNPLASAPPAGMTETRLDTPDGKSLVVWSAAPKSDRAVVLYFHGNAGNLAAREGRFAALRKYGLGVVAAGSRGSSGSTGWPHERVMIADAVLLAGEVPALVGAARVICYGESLGSAVATALAAEGGCDALVLEAPFTSLSDMAEALYGVPHLDLLGRSHWPTLERIAQVNIPLFVLHGTKDTLIPFAQGKAVFAASPSPNKQMVAVEGAGHTNLWQPAGTKPLFAFFTSQ